MAVIDLGDVKYNVTVAGAGPALMLLHGFTGRADSWSDIQPALASRFELIMPDLLGHGWTDAPPDPARYGMEACIDDLIAILTVMGVEKTHLLGYSMGGRIALAAAARQPERFASVILESASPGLATEAERQARIASDHELADFIEREGVERFVARWERMALFASQARLPRLVRARLRKERLANYAKGLANSLRGLGAGVQPSLWERMAALRIPCLIIAGELDTKFVDIATRMAPLIAGSRLALVGGAGHAIHLEQPEEFVRLVLDFAGAARAKKME
jgi:2-succinyl-6-hydroxy-2,4-cyclohexadiene-1-carboxylate synthase